METTIIIAALVLAVLGGAGVVLSLKNKEEKRSKKMRILLITSIASIVIGLATLAVGPIISVKITDSRSYNLMGTLTELVSKNPYIKVNISDTGSIAFIYNNKYEAYGQSNSGGISVYRKDNMLVAFGEEITLTPGMSPLVMVREAILYAAEGNGKIEIEESEKEYTLYRIDIRGVEDIKGLYSRLSSSYASEMLNALFGKEYPKEPIMSISIAVGSNGSFGASANVTVAGEKYRSWNFDGYLPIKNWELDKDWYSDKNTSVEWVNLVNDLAYNMEQDLKAYADENQLDYYTDEPEETDSEKTESNQSEHPVGQIDSVVETGTEEDITSSHHTHGDGTVWHTINNVHIIETQAHLIGREGWAELDDSGKEQTIKELMVVLSEAGYDLGVDSNNFKGTVDSFYELNSLDYTVAEIVIRIGTTMGTIVPGENGITEVGHD